MYITNCVSTGSEAHADSANATFDEAALQLEELGYLHELTSDGVVFSRAEAVVEDYDRIRIAAAAFLGLSAEWNGRARITGSGDRRGCIQGFPSLPGSSLLEEQREGCKEHLLQALRKSVQVHSMGQHFCGVHKYTLNKESPQRPPSRRAGCSCAKRTWSYVAGCMGWLSHTL
jgi:hypothetical protein